MTEIHDAMICLHILPRPLHTLGEYDEVSIIGILSNDIVIFLFQRIR
jgi:hypothetical protein